MLQAFSAGRDALLSWGVRPRDPAPGDGELALAAERDRTIELADPDVLKELDAIQQGNGRD